MLGRNSLAAAVRRVSVLSEERTKPTKFIVAPGALKLTAYSPDFGEAEELVDVDYTGPEMTIGFNSRYVLDALGAQNSGPNRARIEGRFESWSGQKLRGRWFALCYHAHEDLTFMGAGHRVHIEAIEFTDFRNLQTLYFPPTPSLNIVAGPNAQGKSNLLEGLGVMLVGRSFRGAKAAELPRWGADRAAAVSGSHCDGATAVSMFGA